MKRILFLFFATSALVIFAQSNTFACECAIVGNTTLEQQVENKLANSKMVFSGEVIEVKPNTNKYGFVTKFKVAEFWKGSPAEDVTLIGDGSSCEYPFTVGEKYLVYAHIWENILTTSDCSGNLKLENASEELKVLGKGEKPVKSKSQEQARKCPTIDIVHPAIEDANQDTWRYFVRLENADPKLQLTYQWTVLYGDKNGEIKAGQGSDSITIKRGNLSQGVTVGVEIGGLEVGCNNKMYVTWIS